MRGLLLANLIVFVLSSLGFGYVVFFVPPEIGGQLVLINLIYFFTSGFISLASFGSLVLYSAGSFAEKKGLASENRTRALLIKSVRRGSFISATVGFILIFRLLGIANPINVVLVILVAFLAEMYFSGK